MGFCYVVFPVDLACTYTVLKLAIPERGLEVDYVRRSSTKEIVAQRLLCRLGRSPPRLWRTFDRF